MDSDEDLHNFIGVTLLYNILIQSCIVMVSIQQKMGREKISSKLQCRENLTKELSSHVMVQT